MKTSGRYIQRNLLARYDLSLNYNDLSGNGYHGQAGLSAGADSADPVGTYFDGDDVIVLPNVPIGSAYSLYALCRPTNTASVRTILGTNTNQSYLAVNTNGRPLGAVVDASQVSLSGPSLTYPQLLIMALSVAPGAPLRMMIGDIAYVSSSPMSATFPARQLTAIGRNGTTGTLRFLGDIYDTLAYAGNHNFSEMRQNTAWLQSQAFKKNLGRHR